MLFGDKVFTAYGDYTYLICPVFTYISDVFQSGQVPLWIKGMLGGTQIYDSAQFSITYPLYFFRSIDYGNPFTTYQWVKYFTLLHILIFGINTYILAKVFELSNIASAVAGITIMICSNTAIYSNWIIIIAGYSWLPLFLAGTITCFKNDNLLRGPIIAAIGFAGFIANPAQPLIHGLVMALPLVFTGLYLNREKWAHLITKFSIAGGFAFGLAAVGIIPAVINYKEMIRWVGKSGAVRGYQSLPFDAFEHEMPLNTLYNLIWDSGIWSAGPGHPYLGPIAIILAITGIVYTLKTKELKHRWMFCVLAILSFYFLVSAYGKSLGMTYINFYIPLINKIREPVRHLIVYTVGFSIFAGLGYDILTRYISSTRKNKSLIVALSFYIICSAILIAQASSNFSYLKLNYFVLIAVMTVFGAMSFFLKKHQFPFLIILLLGLNALVNKKGNNPAPERWAINKTENLKSLETLKSLKGSGIIDKDDRIVFYDKNLNNQKWSMNATSYNLRGFQSFFSPLHARQFDQLHHCDWNYNFRSLLGTKWYIINKGTKPKEPKLIKQYTIGDFDIYQNPLAKPKLYFAQKPIAYNGQKNDFFGKIKKDSKFQEHVYTSAGDLSRVNTHLQAAACSTTTPMINIIEDSHNKVRANIATAKPKMLVFNEFNNGDWKGTLNGKKLKLITVNLNQMGLLLPCGQNEVILEYKPQLFGILRILQLVTFYTLLIVGFCNILGYFNVIKLPSLLRI